MSEPDDLEERVSALEGQVESLTTRVRRSEQDAAAARVLAGGADRDVADLGGEVRELRSEIRELGSEIRELGSGLGELGVEASQFRDQNNRLHNATREDLADLRGQVRDFRADVDARFARVDDNFIGIRGLLDGAAAGQQRIVELLDTLVARGNEADGPDVD